MCSIKTTVGGSIECCYSSCRSYRMTRRSLSGRLQRAINCGAPRPVHWILDARYLFADSIYEKKVMVHLLAWCPSTSPNPTSPNPTSPNPTFAESHFADSHFADSHFADSHFSESTSPNPDYIIVAPTTDGFIDPSINRKIRLTTNYFETRSWSRDAMGLIGRECT